MKWYLVKASLYLLIFTTWGLLPTVKSADESRQQSTASVDVSLVEKCQISEATIEAIEKAWVLENKTSEIMDLILQAEAAIEPPECDSVRAKILAEEAIRVSDISDSSDSPTDISVAANGDDSREFADNDESISSTEFAIVEGVLALNAWFASESPEGYGILVLLITPFALADASSSTGPVESSLGEYLLSGLAIGVVAGYNLSIDEDDYSKSEVFRNNFLLWNSILGIGYLLGKDDRGDEKQSFFSIQPTQDTTLFTLTYRFD